jgi:hypothetical protein
LLSPSSSASLAEDSSARGESSFTFAADEEDLMMEKEEVTNAL